MKRFSNIAVFAALAAVVLVGLFLSLTTPPAAIAEPAKANEPYWIFDFFPPDTDINTRIGVGTTGNHLYKIGVQFLETSADSSAKTLTAEFKYGAIDETTKHMFVPGSGADYFAWDVYADSCIITAVLDSTDFIIEVYEGP